MKAIEAFEYNVGSARILTKLYEKLRGQGMRHGQVDDLLRSSYVLAVGALDAFVHDRVAERLVPYIRSRLERDPAALAPIEGLLKGVEMREILHWLTLSRPFVQVRKVVEVKIGSQSFQHPGKIEEAFRLIGKVDIWEETAKSRKITTVQLKRDLAQTAKRRNQIVHEGDREQSRRRRHRKRQLKLDEVVELLDLIEEVGRGLSNL
jgi:hypothetical protein